MSRIPVMRVLMTLAVFGGTITPAIHGEELTPPVTETAAEPGESLRRARELLKQAEYDEAIRLLREQIERSRGNLGDLRDSYLLLVETYAIRGNSYRFTDPTASELYYKEARATIHECLETRALRHTRPEPKSDFTPETIALFDQVRSETFGSFLIRKLTPSSALVVFSGDTLLARPDGLIAEDDVPTGNHLLILREEGFRSLTEEIVISPGATVDRSYALQRDRPWYKRPWFYVVAGSAAGALGYWATRDGSEEPEPIGEPPPPPGAR